MTAKSVRLSPAQQHVLDRMREGWVLTLCTSGWANNGAMLSKPGVSGWETPHLGTIDALEKRGLIVRRYGFPDATYTLAAAPDGSTG